MYLKQKKFQDKEIEKASAATLMLQETLGTIESAIADAEVYKALKQGDAIIKELQAQVSIEDWEGLMDDHKEHLANQQREAELFGEPLKDEDLLNELEELERLDAEAELGALGPQKVIIGTKQPVLEDEQEEAKEAVKPKRQLVAA